MIKRIFQGMWQAIIRIFAFISKEARAILHQPRLVFSLILGPFLILLIFGVGYRNSPRTLNTLFVIPEGSKLGEFIEQYSDSLGSRVTFAGVITDADEADRQLRAKEVDVVVVTPFDPMIDWENDEQSIFSLFHYEIDPMEEAYIRVLGQRYAEEINKELLLEAFFQSQSETEEWHTNVKQTKEYATNVREALDAGDQVRAHSSALALKQELDLLSLILGSGVAMVGSLEETAGQTTTTRQLLAELEEAQARTDALVDTTQAEDTLSESQATVAEVEASLTEVDNLLTEFEEIDPYVLVAPFRSESSSVTQIVIDPVHFYVPAVIALLLQHLAVTLSGLSVIREKMGGAMELFKAAPVTALEILIGKYISYLLLIGVVGAILTGLIVWVLRVPQLGIWANYVLILLALLLASLGVGFHISLSSRSDSQAIQYGMVTLLAAIFFSGFFLPLYRLSSATRIVSWLLPATYGTILLQDGMLRGHVPDFLLLTALYMFGIVLFLLAWWRLARQMARE